MFLRVQKGSSLSVVVAHVSVMHPRYSNRIAHRPSHQITIGHLQLQMKLKPGKRPLARNSIGSIPIMTSSSGCGGGGGGASTSKAATSRTLLLLVTAMMATPTVGYASRNLPKSRPFLHQSAAQHPRSSHSTDFSSQMLSFILEKKQLNPITYNHSAGGGHRSKALSFVVLAASTVTGASAASAAAATSGAAALSTALDPLLEAEVLTDLAHISLDLFTVLGPARLATRLAAIVGRLLAMLADYVPDHKVLPEELVFQAIMMVVAFAGLFQALLPVALASLVPSDTMMRDGKVFTTVFEPAGMTWSQYKAMRAYCADWVQVEPGQVICSDGSTSDDDDDDDHIYWLYRGEVEVRSANASKLLCRVNAGPRAPANCTIGETRGTTKKQTSSGERFLGATHLLTGSSFTEHQAGIPTVTIATSSGVGVPSGATLLRIRAGKLKILLESDPDMAETMRRVAFSSLRDKYLAAQHLVVEHQHLHHN